jgi:hypothetical protein
MAKVFELLLTGMEVVVFAMSLMVNTPEVLLGMTGRDVDVNTIAVIGFHC